MEYINLATGGTITRVDKTSNTYSVIHTFTSSGTFTKTTDKTITGYYLVVAGGGAGGLDDGGGGGGAGGLLTNWGGSAVVLPTASVTVGAGGVPNEQGDRVGGNGGNSSYSGITAIGGGGGCGGQDNSAKSGGSGGGASRANNNGGGAGTSGQGFAGAANELGPHGSSNERDYGCGGGGAGGAGQSGWLDWAGGSQTKYYNGGSGGVGKQLTISGSSKWYAAGGQGGFGAEYNSTIFAQNGIGGKGGQKDAGAATAGAANTGSGGGGGGRQRDAGAAGGTGVVILRYDVTRYQVTKYATSNGKINDTTTQSSQWVTAGESATYTVTPNTNYRIGQIIVNGVVQSLTPQELNNGKTLTISPTANTIIQASFVAKPYLTITISDGGEIKVDGSAVSSGYVDYNVAKTYSITPDQGCVIVSVTINGVAQQIPNKLGYTVNIQPTGNTTLAATFTPSGGAVYQHFL